MRPRSVRLAERKRSEPETSKEETRSDAFGPEIEAELASARADRLAAEGLSSRGAFTPGKKLERSPVKVDVSLLDPSASSPTRAGVTRAASSEPSARLSARNSPSAYRTPEKSPVSKSAPRGRFGASGSKSGASPFSAAGERAATRAEAELAAALEASPAGDGGSPVITNHASSGLSHRRRLEVSRSTEKLTAARRPFSPAAPFSPKNAAEAAEGFRNINETLSRLEANAERFENDLLRSSATMAAMDAARREREDAATAALLRRARDARARAEAEDKAEMEARRVVAKRQSKK